MYEEAFFHLIGQLQKDTGLTDLALAGGCAANSVANGKVRRRTRLPSRLCAVCRRRCRRRDRRGFRGVARRRRRPALRHGPCLLGPGLRAMTTSTSCSTARGRSSRKAGCSNETQLTMKRNFAAARRRPLPKGRSSAGSRAGWNGARERSGNRSIVCDPRRADMKDILNAKIKRRESFRPFAPSVLEDAVADWFEEDDAVPFMMQVFQIREEKRRAQIPAVTHVDGSGRLQTVYRQHQPALLSPDRGVPRSDRRADGAQHIVQRERAGRLRPRGGARLLPADQHGRSGAGKSNPGARDRSRPRGNGGSNAWRHVALIHFSNQIRDPEMQ